MTDLQQSDRNALSPLPPEGPVPTLLMNLHDVERTYLRMASALAPIQIHYAMKCNSERDILAHLVTLASHFEISSCEELMLLQTLSVDSRNVLFSNPVKSSHEIAKAFALGVRKFAFDSLDELEKLSQFAPGALVYVRLTVDDGLSDVPSEGKFGVDKAEAEALLQTAEGQGLMPYGIAFHVGSQMMNVDAWDAPLRDAGEIMRNLAADGIALQMLDIGGGFPAQYGNGVPPIEDFAAAIHASLKAHLPYEVQLVAEPGRSLVAEAGTLMCSVVGVATRNGKRWVHLNVGAFNGMMECLETSNTLLYPISVPSRVGPWVSTNVTGPSCDSQDTLFYDVNLPNDVRTGDTVLIGSAGAYTTCYASNFNGFAIPQISCHTGDYPREVTL